MKRAYRLASHSNFVLTTLLCLLLALPAAFGQVDSSGQKANTQQDELSQRMDSEEVAYHRTRDSINREFNKKLEQDHKDNIQVRNIVVGVFVFIILLVVFLFIKATVFNYKYYPLMAIKEGPAVAYSPGLDEKKIRKIWLALHKGDIASVEGEVSEGVYQVYRTQRLLEKKLGQTHNYWSFQVNKVRGSNVHREGNYIMQEVLLAVSKTRDSVKSSISPELNYTENRVGWLGYWQFIKRSDKVSNLPQECPNCNMVFDIDIANVTKCSNCGTLINSIGKEWTLCSAGRLERGYLGSSSVTFETSLTNTMKIDPDFSYTMLNDVAVKLFMMVIQNFVGANDEVNNDKYILQSAHEPLQKLKAQLGDCIFNRFELMVMSYDEYSVTDNLIRVKFIAKTKFQRARLGHSPILVEPAPVERNFEFEISRDLTKLVNKGADATIVHKCQNCGAPYDSMDKNTCNYCGAELLDMYDNWGVSDIAYILPKAKL